MQKPLARHRVFAIFRDVLRSLDQTCISKLEISAAVPFQRHGHRGESYKRKAEQQYPGVYPSQNA